MRHLFPASLSIFLGLIYLTKSGAFSPLQRPPLAIRSPDQPLVPTYLKAEAEGENPLKEEAREAEDPLEEMDQKRKDNLFQCLLRDLQIEGTPLLECDAFQAHTLQAALWTTMAELSGQNQTQKVCLVLQEIGVDALRTFVDDFLILKSQSRLLDHLPELDRFHIEVVGKGVGPAIIIETTTNLTDATLPTSSCREAQVSAAQKAFMDRLIVEEQVCPYTKSSSRAPEGLEAVSIQPSPIGYRYCGFDEACHVLSAFWNCLCELLATDNLSSIVLSLPAIGEEEDENHARFSALAELLSRSLCLFRGDDVFETLHFYPHYDRNQVFPPDLPAHGHLPPLSFINPMIRRSGLSDSPLSEEEVALTNYQRRAPFTAVVIKRVSYFGALPESANEIVDLELDDGRVEKASGVLCYANNAIKLAAQGEAALSEALQAERAIGKQ